MFRSSPPSGRVHRLLTIATLLCSVVFVAPAGAQAPTEAASELPQPTIAAKVTGLDPLRVTATGEDIRLTVTDAAGNVAAYNLDPAAAQDGEYAIDLNAPDAGSPPVNGTATVAISAGGSDVLTVEVVLDRDPAAPTLGATGSPRAARLTWPAVAGPGAVTYRLERTTAGAVWSTLADDFTDTSYRDADVAPGRYRYRLTAAAPAAGEGVNRSGPAFAAVRIAAVPEPPPPPPPPAAAPATGADPFPQTPATLPELATPVPTRAVAVAGDIRRGVAEHRRRPKDPTAVANRPGLSTLLHNPLTAFAPRIANSGPTPNTVAAPETTERSPLPVPVAPGSMLAVEAVSGLAATQLGDLGTVLAAGLLAATSGLARRRRKRADYSAGGRSPVNT